MSTPRVASLGYVTVAAGLAAVLVACATAAPPSATPPTAVTTLDVYRTLGSKQCEGGGQSLDQLAAELTRAGVPVRAASCGRDGRMRVAMCGASDGRIGIYTIAVADLQRATRAGFDLLEHLSDARREACAPAADGDARR